MGRRHIIEAVATSFPWRREKPFSKNNLRLASSHTFSFFFPLCSSGRDSEFPFFFLSFRRVREGRLSPGSHPRPLVIDAVGWHRPAPFLPILKLPFLPSPLLFFPPASKRKNPPAPEDGAGTNPDSLPSPRAGKSNRIPFFPLSGRISGS